VSVIQAFAPLLGADHALKGAPGRIVNISSVGGQIARPFVTPYNTSKFAVEGLCEGLRRELRHRRDCGRAGRGGDADLGQG
jgi:NAD(P)-dependent dehydrogenase (short-subunit alcohol dehydrogenase family)